MKKAGVVMSAEFESKKKAVKNWLDRVVKNKTALVQLGKSEYNDFGIELCGYDKSLHIYKGLETIAFYLGKTVSYNPNWDAERGYMSFEYKDFHIFQLWDKES